MEIGKSSDSDFDGLMPDSGNYDGVSRIEIRIKGREKSKSFCDGRTIRFYVRNYGKLMRAARIARQGAIYDAPAAAQTVAKFEMGNFQIANETRPESGGGWSGRSFTGRDKE